jgi:TonB family protein
MMKPIKSQNYLARMYEKGGSKPLPITLGMDGGEILAYDDDGRSIKIPFEDWDLKLGGTREDRVVLTSNTTGETIIADLKLLDAVAAGTKYGHLTQQAKKLKSGAALRGLRQSSGVIFIVVAILAFIGWVSLGFAGYNKEGGLSDRQNQTTETVQEENSENDASGSTENMSESRYMSIVQKQIKNNWHPHSHKGAKAVVLFELNRDGTINNARMKHSTGDVALDRTTVKAVEASSPLPPLPNQIPEPAQVEFTFRVND